MYDSDDAMNQAKGLFTLKRMLIVLVVLICLPLSFKLVEVVGSGENVVIQSPFTGALTWYTAPGPKMQLFGEVTRYPKSEQFWFSKAADQGKGKDESISTGFNDNGRAGVSGSIRVDYPENPENLTKIHVKYGSHASMMHALIRPWMERVIFQSGATMSSTESVASRRTEFPSIIADQASHGLYRMMMSEVKVKDVLSGQEKTAKVAEPIKEEKAPGGIARAEKSNADELGIRLYSLSISAIDYDAETTKQVQAQQKIAMEIQTSMADARKAEQAAITALKNGEAKAAEAKWAQEALKATAVTAAEQEFEVAVLANKQATQEKEKLIKEGEGEGTKRRLLMQADNALAAKLAALITISGYQAKAIENFKGNLVPQVIMGGGSGGNSGNSVQDLLTMMMMQNAKMLNLNLGSATGAPTK